MTLWQDLSHSEGPKGPELDRALEELSNTPTLIEIVSAEVEI